MQTGRDKAVQDFLKAQPDSQDYLADLEHLLRRWAPKISQSGRPSVTLVVSPVDSIVRFSWSRPCEIA